ADFFVDRDQLEGAEASAIAGAAAEIATASESQVARNGAIDAEPFQLAGLRLVGRGTLPADFADKSLRQYADQTAGDQIRLDSQIDQSRHSAGGVICVKRAENQMTRQRRL